jgi:hypothetical protein
VAKTLQQVSEALAEGPLIGGRQCRQLSWTGAVAKVGDDRGDIVETAGGARSPAAPTRRLAPRPARWAAATAALLRLQEEYRDWLDNLPPNLESSALAAKLQTIVELDLDELQAVDLPLGYGRD